MSIIHPFLISKGEKPPVPGVGHRVRFYDYDGTLLKTQYVASGNNATAPIMPDYSVATADRPALIFQAWNNSLYNIQQDMDLGAIYKTADEKTYLYMEFTPTTGKNPTLYINKTDTTVLNIDWGDTTVETNNTNGNTTLTHTYANYGSYVIKIYIEGTANVKWKIGQNSSSTTLFGNTGNTYSPCLKALYIGGNISTIQNYGLSYCYNLKKLTMPTLVDTLGIYALRYCYGLEFFIGLYTATTTPQGLFYYCYGLKKVIISNNYTALANDTFLYCVGLEEVFLPTGLLTIGEEPFNYCRNLKKIVIPSSVTTLGDTVFNECVNMTEYIFLPTTPPTIGTDIFKVTNLGCKIYVPDDSIDAYKGATNWSAYADYIYPLSEFEEVE